MIHIGDMLMIQKDEFVRLASQPGTPNGFWVSHVNVFIGGSENPESHRGFCIDCFLLAKSFQWIGESSVACYELMDDGIFKPYQYNPRPINNEDDMKAAVLKFLREQL